MLFDARTIDIPTAGTRVQVLNDPRRVRWIRFTARAANTGAVFVGDSNVSSSRGRALYPPVTANTMGLNTTTEYGPGMFGSRVDGAPGGIVMSTFYVDTATNGNDVDVEILFE